MTDEPTTRPSEPCPDCNGTGLDYDETCLRCGGEGRIDLEVGE